ncbi:ROK family transcriptional regulator [Bifidobacterium apri]|uniref:NagC family transcriptional regulator n=1 Tax=Bifidobacterium apri TaxID=1769423 RepID=A0A6A2VAQ9_9BIFI|nr:ROK family transcriptional regulator [Bifidobacterium apri]KAB8301839.1 NagC family transcriptional regulator [Bifidobacterium apri]
MNTESAATATRSTVSETNRSRVLHYLYTHGISSRASIAEALGLSAAAITKITARLIDADIIHEVGGIEGRKNRRSIGLELDPHQFHFIGVKFARSLVEIGVFDLKGETSSLTDLPPVKNDAIPDTIRIIHETITTLLDNDPSIVAIGMAVPGPYLRHEGRTAVVSSMQGWRTFNFIDEFLGAFRVPIFIEQDARAGVLAQYLLDPSSSNCRNLAYYLLGEGVGLGVIDDGRLVNGAQGAAAEIGHVSIDVNGLPCDCGNRGCLELYCSAVAIHRRLTETGIIPDSDNMTHKQACHALFEQAAQGDADAQALVHEIGRYVGYGCVTIFNTFNPERIVLGDIVAEGGQPLLDAAREVVDERVIPELNQATTICLSKLPADAAVIGAAAVAVTQFLEHPSRFFTIT